MNANTEKYLRAEDYDQHDGHNSANIPKNKLVFLLLLFLLLSLLLSYCYIFAGNFERKQ